MSKFCLISELMERGCISQCTDKIELLNSVKNKTLSIYCGFDITADSLHIGHILPLICLKRFQIVGHKPIVLLGQATSLIGDPSFKLEERILNTEESILIWKEKISKQISLFLDFNCDKNNAKIVNNKDWFNNMNILTFLRKVGKHFSVNQMMNKESVKRRIVSENQGISFTEFSYSLLQAYDFSELNRKYSVTVQIGGSDQWGNIISGVLLTRKLFNRKVFGLTLPLLTQSNGIKFGKTETGTLWLDPEKTTPYKFYQFWINRSDIDIINFLKYFTFLSVNEIHSRWKVNMENNDDYWSAKVILAEHMTRLIHGNQGLLAAKRISSCLFSGSIENMLLTDFEQLKQDGIPYVELSGHEDLVQSLINSTLATSRTQAYNMINSNAVYVNNKMINNTKYYFKNDDKIFGKYSLLRRGKKNYYLLCW
ncbi:tyrosine--tRNA ligase [Buchnera aphidicola (Formosaphis micheliae)]|uniref:tyrosine--tRNA ligase n=1 Tax=Buchnera aphidicola TaxID=9 RepID=UPI0031CCD997